VFDNACKYNESDSQIYKDAQTLQRLAHQTVRHLTEDGDGVPDARAAVQDILGQYFVVPVCFIYLQCVGSGSAGSVCFWASWIRIQ
jgi:hypothetical protein